jgi:type IV pilus assembly protein PilA
MSSATKRLRPSQHGFTLIELMIVVAIIGILAAIAIPAYADFQVRARTAEVLGFASACKVTVEVFYGDNANSFAGVPSDLCGGIAGLGESKHIQSVAINPDGSFEITTRNMGAGIADGQTLVMAPADTASTTLPPGGRIERWVCGATGTTLAPRFRPGSCQGI